MMSKITLGSVILYSIQIQFDEVIVDPLITTLVDLVWLQAIIVGLHSFRAFHHVFYWPINICIDLTFM